MPVYNFPDYRSSYETDNEDQAQKMLDDDIKWGNIKKIQNADYDLLAIDKEFEKLYSDLEILTTKELIAIYQKFDPDYNPKTVPAKSKVIDLLKDVDAALVMQYFNVLQSEKEQDDTNSQNEIKEPTDSQSGTNQTEGESQTINPKDGESQNDSQAPDAGTENTDQTNTPPNITE